MNTDSVRGKLLAIIGSSRSLYTVTLIMLLAFVFLFYIEQEFRLQQQTLHTLEINAEKIVSAEEDASASVRLAASLRSKRFIFNYENTAARKVRLLKASLELTAG